MSPPSVAVGVSESHPDSVPIWTAPVVALPVQQRHDARGEVDRRLDAAPVDEAVVRGLRLVALVDTVAGRLPVVHVRVGQEVREDEVHDVGRLRAVRNVLARLPDQPQRLVHTVREPALPKKTLL